MSKQEIAAGFLETSILQDKSVSISKKRKHDTEMEPETAFPKGDSSKEGTSVLIAIAEPVDTIGTSTTIVPEMGLATMEPEMDVSMLVSTNGTSTFKQAELRDIHHKISQASQLLGNWITETSVNSVEKKQEIVTSSLKADSSTQTELSVLKSQIQSLTNKYAAAEARHHMIVETYQLEKKKLS